MSLSLYTSAAKSTSDPTKAKLCHRKLIRWTAHDTERQSAVVDRKQNIISPKWTLQ